MSFIARPPCAQVIWNDQFSFRAKFLAAVLREGKFQYLGCLTSITYLLDTPNHDFFLLLCLAITLLCLYHLSHAFVSDLEIMRAMATGTMASTEVVSGDLVTPKWHGALFWQLYKCAAASQSCSTLYYMH